jgi:hypothetical protein
MSKYSATDCAIDESTDELTGRWRHEHRDVPCEPRSARTCGDVWLVAAGSLMALSDLEDPRPRRVRSLYAQTTRAHRKSEGTESCAEYSVSDWYGLPAATRVHSGLVPAR